MKSLLQDLYKGSTPFCFIQKQDSEDVLFLSGEAHQFRNISDIPRKYGVNDAPCYDTISVVPFCQIRERGYEVHDGGESILTLEVRSQREIDVADLKASLPTEDVRLLQDIQYDTTEEGYGQIIGDIIKNEIGNGEGANFVVPRNITGQIADFSVAHALTIFRSLLENDYGTYWKFIFYDTNRFFIGSTPERHLYVQGGRVKMNPISGTFRKDRKWNRQKDFKKDLLHFLTDQKEINELFMVVDEELKMMAKMCDRGGAVIGPLLKEMSKLIHSEYLLSGESDKDIFELFRDSMFAATVVGSPVENACKIISKYSDSSRRYYGSAMMLVGRDENGEDFLDSPIMIRTAEIDCSGAMNLSVGATLVRDSVPAEEVLETKAKSAGILGSITKTHSKDDAQALLSRFYNDDDIIETLAQRNQNLSNFWFFRQENKGFESCSGKRIRATIIHNEDDFVYMIRHMLLCMGLEVTIVRYNDYDIEKDTGDITLLGPGPGNPNEHHVEKIAINSGIADALLKRNKPSLFICLGYQILCKQLGFTVRRKEKPLQGSQIKVNLFGRDELVGFYNTFAPQVPEKTEGFEIAEIPELNEMIAIRTPHFIGYQFHPESLLTQNGFSLLRETVEYLLQGQDIKHNPRNIG